MTALARRSTPAGSRPQPLLRLAAVALSTLGSLSAQPAASSGRTGPDPTGAAAIRAMLTRLDQQFARGDRNGYLATFAPDHPGAHAAFEHHLDRLLGANAERSCSSLLVGAPVAIGPRTVVRVQQSLRLGPSQAPRLELVEHSLLAIDLRADGSAVPTLVIAVPPEWRGNPAGKFRCDACNYEIGGAPGWLCTPVLGERACSLEAATFWLLGTDIACDVSVEIDPDAPTASAVAQRLGDAMRQLAPELAAPLVQPWRPLPAASEPVAGLSGARLELDLAAGDADARSRVQLHVTAFGGLQHVLLVRGGERSLQTHAAAVQQLLASYRLLQLEVTAVEAAREALEHHTGGAFTGSTYRNLEYGVDLQGPAEWTTEQRPGGALFRVAWRSKDGSRLWLTGHRVPAGLPRWDTRAADRWLSVLCEQQQLELVDAAVEWSPPGDCGGPTRALQAVPRGADRAIAPPRRWIRLQVHDDLLLIADGFATNEADERLLRAALGTLRRP